MDGEGLMSIDPSKVKAGDTVTLEDRRQRSSGIDPDPDWRLTGKVREIVATHISKDGVPYVWNVRIGHSPYQMGTGDQDWTYTLTDHQPAPEPEPEWKPGTVAWVKAGSWSGNATLHGDVWISFDGEYGTWGEEEVVTDVRPLVVIDPAAVDVDTLQRRIEEAPGGEEARDALAELGVEVPQ